MDLSRLFSGRESWEVAQEQRAFYHLLGRGFYLLYLNPEDEAGDTFDQAEWAGLTSYLLKQSSCWGRVRIFVVLLWFSPTSLTRGVFEHAGASFPQLPIDPFPWNILVGALSALSQA